MVVDVNAPEVTGSAAGVRPAAISSAAGRDHGVRDHGQCRAQGPQVRRARPSPATGPRARRPWGSSVPCSITSRPQREGTCRGRSRARHVAEPQGPAGPQQRPPAARPRPGRERACRTSPRIPRPEAPPPVISGQPLPAASGPPPAPSRAAQQGSPAPARLSCKRPRLRLLLPSSCSRPRSLPAARAPARISQAGSGPGPVPRTSAYPAPAPHRPHRPAPRPGGEAVSAATPGPPPDLRSDSPCSRHCRAIFHFCPSARGGPGPSCPASAAAPSRAAAGLSRATISSASARTPPRPAQPGSPARRSVTITMSASPGRSRRTRRTSRRAPPAPPPAERPLVQMQVPRRGACPPA